MNSEDHSSLRFAIIAEGSRGDIQPYVALALHLQKRGNVARIFTNVNHVSFVEGFGLEVKGVMYDFQEGIDRPDVRKAYESGNPLAGQQSMVALTLESMDVDLKRLFDELDEFEPSVVGYGIMSFSKAIMYSVARTVPAAAINLQVFLPCQDKAPWGLPTLPFKMNRAWFWLFMKGLEINLPVFIEKAKAGVGIDFSSTLTMEYVSMFYYDIPALPAPSFNGISTAVILVHPEWPTTNFHLCGFFVVDKETQESLAKGKGTDFGAESYDELMKFVQAGPPPVYMGWGSMLCKSAEYMSRIAVEGLQRSGQRAVICSGWAGLSEETMPEHLKQYVDDNVLFVKSAPHEILFPHCSCIVHHGGSGTTAASVRSGKPTVIVPVGGDEYDFADGINQMNCGVGLPQFSQVTSAELGDAIQKCIEDQIVIEAAKVAGEKLRAENGCENFARAFDEWWVSGFKSGQWLEKHKTMLEKSKAARAESCCVVS
mmetsp:Transcript_73178/g.184802  ORF Transcript_73178/g.184802 Transcript_73178/m.184802 type:complete len:484 (+) Transcript_73178:80-1531(+)